MRRVRGRFDVPGRRAAVVVEGTADGAVLEAADVAVEGPGSEAPELPVAEEALARVGEVLVGASMADGVARLAARVEAVIGPGPAWLPEATAVAVRRALGDATDWAEHSFEVIHDGALAPATHMALDQVLAESVGAGERRATLRIWEWDAPAVVLGSFQSLRNEVDPGGAVRHGVSVVRRVSGGGAMFIQPEGAITFSLTVPASLVEGMSFATSYAFLDDWVVAALRGLGIQASYVPLNDIASPRGKIAGAAQKRLASGAVLHHVTMAYDMDSAVMLEVLTDLPSTPRRAGHEERPETRGPPAQPDRPAPRRRRRGVEGDLPRAVPVRRGRGHAG